MRAWRGNSGLSLAEALIALGLLCIFIVPIMGMLRQSGVNYSRAYEDYQGDLALTGLLAQVKGSVETGAISDIAVSFSDDGRFEYEVIIEDFASGQTRVIHCPEGGGPDVEPGGLNRNGNFSGLITAAVKDARTGLIKIKVLPY